MATISELRQQLFRPPNGLYNSSSYWNNQIKEDLFFRNVFLTIDLIFGNGAQYRFATDLVTVTDDNGNIFVYEPALFEEPTITTQFTLGEGQASLRTFTLTLDARDIDPLSMIKDGFFLSGIAEICLQIQNGNHENRMVLMRGEMSSSINFGVKQEMIEIQISDVNLSKDKIIPEHLITEEDFPALPDDFKGNRFPLIKGNSTCGIPCIRTSDYTWGPTFIVSFGHNINITEVSINGIPTPSNDLQRGWEKREFNTDSGIPFTAIVFVFPVDSIVLGNVQIQGQPWGTDESVYVKVDSGIKKSVIEQIKDLIINETNFGIDIVNEDLFGKSQTKAPYLCANFLINGSTSEEATNALDYIQNTVCLSFPMFSMVYSNNGIGLIVTDRRNNIYTQSFIVGSGDILDRSTGITELSREEIYNSFTFRYDYDAVNDTYKKVVKRDSTNSMICKISENRLGKRDYEVIDSVIVSDDSTAQFIVEWMADHFALPSYYIEYDCVSSIVLKVSIGDNIIITDDELGFSEVKGTIEKVEYNKSKVVLGIRLWLIYEQLSKSA